MSDKNASTGVHITEGTAGYYYFHLSRAGEVTRSLCGKPVMNTLLPLATWGMRGHLNEKYCSACADMARNELLAAGVKLPA